jgi:hypothetical protein
MKDETAVLEHLLDPIEGLQFEVRVAFAPLQG